MPSLAKACTALCVSACANVAAPASLSSGTAASVVNASSLYSAFSAVPLARRTQNLKTVGAMSPIAFYQALTSITTNDPVTVNGHLFSNSLQKLEAAKGSYDTLAARFPTMQALWTTLHVTNAPLTEAQVADGLATAVSFDAGKLNDLPPLPAAGLSLAGRFRPVSGWSGGVNCDTALPHALNLLGITQETLADRLESLANGMDEARAMSPTIKNLTTVVNSSTYATTPGSHILIDRQNTEDGDTFNYQAMIPNYTTTSWVPQGNSVLNNCMEDTQGASAMDTSEAQQ